MKKLIDIGVNFNYPQIKNNLEEIILNSIENNIEHIVLTTTDETTLKFNLELTNKNPKFFSTTWGLHPHNAKHLKLFKETELHLENKNITSIGEIGLDFFREISSQEQQIEAFYYFLEKAKQYPDKNLFLHERMAHHTFLNIIKTSQISNKAVVHCFTGDKTQLKNYLDAGFFIGITGWLCDERRNQDLKEAIKYIPLDKLMFETDSPFLKPRTIKTKTITNEPSNLLHIIEYYSKLTNHNIDILLENAYNNSVTFFNISKSWNQLQIKPH